MKVLHWVIIVVGAMAVASCGGGEAGGENETPADSQMVAEHIDPSTKFPQELVEADTLQTDAKFVDNAIQSAEESMALAELGIKKAGRDEVRKIAQTISRDQRQIHSALQQLQKPARDSAKRYTDGSRATLEKLAGNAFDRQWVEKMVTWNAAVISRFENESGATKDKGIKKLVDDALSKLKAHQQQLETCRTKLQ